MTEHEKKINAFIPTAKRYSTKFVKESISSGYTIPGVDGKPVHWDIWTQVFHYKMNQLTSEAGLRVL